MSSIPSSMQQQYEQMIPPNDLWKDNWPGLSSVSTPTTDALPQPTAPASAPGLTSGSSSSSHSSHSPGKTKVEKKDKYREKNRVAAAKCRAKKKERTDGLEEDHRTQSMLNGLLKQTEQNLRDELSHLRTQALQHGYCGCHPIQDYNMRKARDIAVDHAFGGAQVDAQVQNGGSRRGTTTSSSDSREMSKSDTNNSQSPRFYHHSTNAYEQQ